MRQKDVIYVIQMIDNPLISSIEENCEKRILDFAIELLDKVCRENYYRDKKIMQGVEGEKKHSKAVLSWVEKLLENPSIELRISSLFHDIDRVVTPGVGGGFKGDRNSKEYLEHKKAHAKRSADYICRQLSENGIDPVVIDRVSFLVSHHDDTGTEVETLNDAELDMLVAADSLAFFDTIAPKLYEAEGESRVRDKVRFMMEKMPKPIREIMASIHLDDHVFDRIRKEVLEELK